VKTYPYLDTLKETPYFVCYSLLLYTGLRRGEALALKWKSIDLVNKTLQVNATVARLDNSEYEITEPKTAKSRRCIPIPSSMNLLLLEYKADQEDVMEKLGKQLDKEDYVFVQNDGMPINPNTLTSTFIKAIRKSNLPHIRLHDLRHTHASLMLKTGEHPKVVSERLGHANINITMDIYSHVMPGIQNEAAERFDRLLEDDNSDANVNKRCAKDKELRSRPYRSRTCDTLIKRYKKAMPDSNNK